MPGGRIRGMIGPMRAGLRSLKPVYALLLCWQTVGGGMVALAHATEPPTAPVAIEGEHNARCAVVHDALRCAVCQWAGIQITGVAVSLLPLDGPVYQTSHPASGTVLPPRLHGPDAVPRAPPAPLS